MDFTVECYSGARYAERPKALVSEEHRLEISEVLNSWRSPAGMIFQVITEDRRVFKLIFEEDSSQWTVEEA